LLKGKVASSLQNYPNKKKKRRLKMSSTPVPPVPISTSTPASSTPATPAPLPPPPPSETVGAAATQVASDIASDAVATKAVVEADVIPLWEQAAAEYHSLEPALQGRLHQLLNDIESLKAVALPALHTFLSGVTKK
jgi:hypothetical protein